VATRHVVRRCSGLSRKKGWLSAHSKSAIRHAKTCPANERYSSFVVGSNNGNGAADGAGADGSASSAAAAHLEHVQYGEFSCPSVQQLREECRLLTQQLQGREDVQLLQKVDGGDDATSRAIVWHTLPHANVLHSYADNNNDNDDATFHVASQFNCLEMTKPSVKPESGIAGYVNDRTQGPVSAMACAAGTAFRNYLVNVNDVMKDTNDATSNSENNHSDNNKNNDIANLGQTENHQINTLADIMTQLEQRVTAGAGAGDDATTVPRPLIRVRNDYAKATEASLQATHTVLLNDSNEHEQMNGFV
jgi:hypothetical protein